MMVENDEKYVKLVKSYHIILKNTAIFKKLCMLSWIGKSKEKILFSSVKVQQKTVISPELYVLKFLDLFIDCNKSLVNFVSMLKRV